MKFLGYFFDRKILVKTFLGYDKNHTLPFTINEYRWKMKYLVFSWCFVLSLFKFFDAYKIRSFRVIFWGGCFGVEIFGLIHTSPSLIYLSTSPPLPGAFHRVLVMR